ncbi:MAG: ATP-binding protein [Candidatus Thiodiazotropha sp.]
MGNPISIRRRLLIRLTLAIVISWMAATGFVYIAAYTEVEEIYDAALALQSRVLATLMTHEAEEEQKVKKDLQQLVQELGPELIERSPLFRQLIKEYLNDQKEEDYLTLIDRKAVPGHRYESKVAFMVIDGDDQILLRYNMPAEDNTFAPGFSDRMMAGQLWRTFGLIEPTLKLRVQVGEQYSVRQETVEYIVFNSLWPLFAALPFIGLVIWFTVSYGLKPLQQVAGKVEQRDPNSLVPISPDGVPQEVQPMLESLNRLFSRVQHALDNERQFTADAAHELRTPLAALKATAQAKQINELDVDHRSFLSQIVKGVDRTSHLLEQLLTLARMESQSMTMKHLQPVDLCRQVLDVLSEIGPNALDREIGLAFESEKEQIKVMGNAPALQILIRNLVDNAIRYTATGGEIDIRVSVDTDKAHLIVEDSGPGIPDEQISSLFQRFKRGNNTKTEGSGLGLSIVKRIIELHQARITLTNCEKKSGLRVSIDLNLAM